MPFIMFCVFMGIGGLLGGPIGAGIGAIIWILGSILIVIGNQVKY